MRPRRSASRRVRARRPRTAAERETVYVLPAATLGGRSAALRSASWRKPSQRNSDCRKSAARSRPASASNSAVVDGLEGKVERPQALAGPTGPLDSFADAVHPEAVSLLTLDVHGRAWMNRAWAPRQLGRRLAAGAESVEWRNGGRSARSTLIRWEDGMKAATEELDRQAELLRDHVPAGVLRGVTEAFAVAYERLSATTASRRSC